MKKHTLLVRGERVTAIALMSINGIIDVTVHKGTTNGDTFYDFVTNILLPNLQPFNGFNSHSIVVMDNCAIHHVSEIVRNCTFFSHLFTRLKSNRRGIFEGQE